MKLRIAFGSIAIIALLIFVAFATQPGLVQALRGNWNFTRSVERDTGTYFRLKVGLTYKGEPQDFDIVVGCNVRQTNYMDGGRTLEVGLIPSVFGRRMSDGRGLVVRPPRACAGETTENAGIPPDLMPIVVVYDDAETLAFGVAYLSDDAYDSSLSVLKFGGATISPADRADFDRFRSEQPNLVNRSSYHTPSGAAALKERGLPAARIPMGTGCYGYARFRLTGAQKESASRLWPADRPQYWLPANAADKSAIDDVVPYSRPMRTDHEGAPMLPRYSLLAGMENEVANRGMPRRNPVPWGKFDRAVAASYYPNIGEWIALPWPEDAAKRAAQLLSQGPRFGASIDFRNGMMRGFAYSRPLPQIFPTGVSYADPFKAPAASYYKMSTNNRIDNVAVEGATLGGQPALIIERDEFTFQDFVFGLGSTRGDV
jgi:hypothetical protein